MTKEATRFKRRLATGALITLGFGAMASTVATTGSKNTGKEGKQNPITTTYTPPAINHGFKEHVPPKHPDTNTTPAGVPGEPRGSGGNGPEAKRPVAGPAPDTSLEHAVDVIAQNTYKALAEAEARRLNKGSDHPPKTDTNLFPAGVVGEPGGSEDERLVNGKLPAAETGVDHGVTGPAEQGLPGTTEPAGQINAGTTPTGEVAVLSRPLVVPQGLVSQDR